MEKLIFPLSKKEAERTGAKYSSDINKNALFPTLLRELRKKEGISQAKLAEEIGVTKSTIGLYETGDNVPDIKTLARISEYYQVSCDYLIGKDECKTPDNEEIHKKLGLSKTAIERLENANEFLEKGFMMKEKFDACNFVIENFNDSDFFRNLYSYVFETFAFPDPEKANTAVFTTEIVSSKGDGKIKIGLLNSKDINDSFLVKVQHDIVEMKNKYMESAE